MTSTGRSTSTSRANLARLPSLKQLSDRLGPKENEKADKAKDEDKKEKEQQKPALSEITTITTNVPIAAPTPVSGSRLKLPPSAVARANLSPDGTRAKKEGQATKSTNDRDKPETTKASQDTKQTGSQSQSKSVSKKVEPSTPSETTEPGAVTASTASRKGADDANGAPAESVPAKESYFALESTMDKNAADDAGKVEDDQAKDDTQVEDNQGKPDVHRTVRALGMGRPGMPSTPPSRRESVPDIVVQSSTPSKSEVSEETEKRVAAALAAGQHPLAHSW